MITTRASWLGRLGMLALGLYVAACATDGGVGGTSADVLSSNMTTYVAGSSVTITYTGMAGTATDWLAISHPGDPATTYQTWQYTGGATSGSAVFNNLPAGTWEARAYYNNSFVVSQTSPSFTITSTSGSVTTDAGTYASGTPVNASFTIGTATAFDWIAIAQQGAPDSSFTAWHYTNGQTSGSVQFTTTLAAGTYVARLFTNNSYTKVAESAAFTVSGGTPPTPTLTPPSSVAAGGTINVGFAGFPGGATDWITIAHPSDPDNTFITWSYTSGQQSGTLTFAGQPAGTYEARGYYNWPTGGYTVQVRATFTVSSVASTPPRPVFPSSQTVVATRRPTVRWELGAGGNGARVEFCRDRACVGVIELLNVTGTSTQPTNPLPVGTVFWRVRAFDGGSITGPYSSTYEFMVPNTAATASGSYGSIMDVNGDGRADLGVGADRGQSAYIFMGGSSGLSSSAAATLSGGSRFGAVASAGDVNGDGFGDVIVGAYGISSNQGEAYIYLGSSTGLSTTIATTLTNSDGANAFFGSVVGCAGDLNGDGYSDVVATAYGAASNTGNVYVYYGSASGISASPSVTIASPAGAGSKFGYNVSTAADLNADGYSDLLVSADGADTNQGHVYVFMGSSTGISTSPTTSIASPATSSLVGYGFGYVLSSGDVNGDGYADVAISAPSAANGTTAAAGGVYVFHGGASGIATSPATSLFGTYGASALFGLTNRIGDYTGDGNSDLIVGTVAPGLTGWVDEFDGSASGIGTTASVNILSPNGSGKGFGGSSGAADFNGDGRWDAAVGSFNEGIVYVYPGGGTGIASAASPTLVGPGGAASRFGIYVAP